ncbi:TetR family transcriptional regulator [Ideonella sp.]|uniref:TetR family transcriptional regulator n=1 Tax=Ideonella sp. TaxID=1929293 RepID=UPI0035AD8781
MVRRTKAEAESTRHQILDAAEREFLARGVAHTRLQDVAVAAGVTRGAIYWHFEDKAALFNAMMERAFLPCEAGECPGCPPADDPLGRLMRQATWPLRVLAENEQVQRVFRIAMHQTEYTEELASVQQRYLEGINQFRDDLQAQLEVASQAGLLRPGLSLKAVALGLFALVDGLMHHWTLQPGGFDLVECGDAAVKAYVNGLRAALPAAPPSATAAAPAAPGRAPRARRSPPARST